MWVPAVSRSRPGLRVSPPEMYLSPRQGRLRDFPTTTTCSCFHSRHYQAGRRASRGSAWLLQLCSSIGSCGTCQAGSPTSTAPASIPRYLPSRMHSEPPGEKGPTTVRWWWWWRRCVIAFMREAKDRERERIYANTSPARSKKGTCRRK